MKISNFKKPIKLSQPSKTFCSPHIRTNRTEHGLPPLPLAKRPADRYEHFTLPLFRYVILFGYEQQRGNTPAPSGKCSGKEPIACGTSENAPRPTRIDREGTILLQPNAHRLPLPKLRYHQHLYHDYFPFLRPELHEIFLSTVKFPPEILPEKK